MRKFSLVSQNSLGFVESVAILGREEEFHYRKDVQNAPVLSVVDKGLAGRDFLQNHHELIACKTD